MIIVLAPDSFKGPLSAVDVCASWARGLRRIWPEADLRFCPMADGGEGTLDVLLAATGGERRRLTVTGASGNLLGNQLPIIPAPKAYRVRSTALCKSSFLMILRRCTSTVPEAIARLCAIACELIPEATKRSICCSLSDSAAAFVLAR